MDLQRLKALLRVQGDQEDAFFAAVLPGVRDGVRAYTGQTFITESGEDDFPPVVEMAIAKWVQAYTNPAGVASQSVGSLSQSFRPDGSGIPADAAALLDVYVQTLDQPTQRGSFRFVQQHPEREQSAEQGRYMLPTGNTGVIDGSDPT